MTRYAYYKDSQFRIIPEGVLVPEEPDWTQKYMGNPIYKAKLQHAKDQSVPAEDQKQVESLIRNHPDHKFLWGFVDDTIYPFEFEGRVHILDTNWPGTRREVARLLPSKPKEDESIRTIAWSNTNDHGGDNYIINPVEKEEVKADKPDFEAMAIALYQHEGGYWSRPKSNDSINSIEMND